MPSDLWCTQARASLHSNSPPRAPVGVRAGACWRVRLGVRAWACACGIARVRALSSRSLSARCALGGCVSTLSQSYPRSARLVLRSLRSPLSRVWWVCVVACFLRYRVCSSVLTSLSLFGSILSLSLSLHSELATTVL